MATLGSIGWPRATRARGKERYFLRPVSVREISRGRKVLLLFLLAFRSYLRASRLNGTPLALRP